MFTRIPGFSVNMLSIISTVADNQTNCTRPDDTKKGDDEGDHVFASCASLGLGALLIICILII